MLALMVGELLTRWVAGPCPVGECPALLDVACPPGSGESHHDDRHVLARHGAAAASSASETSEVGAVPPSSHGAERSTCACPCHHPATGMGSLAGCRPRVEDRLRGHASPARLTQGFSPLLFRPPRPPAIG
ncbi:MAG: hypothetical protein FJ125_09870 [Deltaproteobacteria bacterium]|nr:hypothetical protein [Deltaproteobacteria bacterium]